MTNWRRMMPFMQNMEMNITSMMGSSVSWTVVNTREAVPAQFMKDVIRDNCPVDLLEKVV